VPGWTCSGEEEPEVKPPPASVSVMCVGEAMVAYGSDPGIPRPRPRGRAWSSC
jgi:hypothetical protein